MERPRKRLKLDSESYEGVEDVGALETIGEIEEDCENETDVIIQPNPVRF